MRYRETNRSFHYAVGLGSGRTVCVVFFQYSSPGLLDNCPDLEAQPRRNKDEKKCISPRRVWMRVGSLLRRSQPNLIRSNSEHGQARLNTR